MRGARCSVQSVSVASGIIPACAGSTSTTRERRCRPRDHPRMCGEHSPTLAAGLNTMGSSPHVRGAQSAEYSRLILTGIIPACAGSTRRSPIRTSKVRDHPRMCGEHGERALSVFAESGSSPHVRGAPDAVCRELRGGGIIPACAGSTMGVRSRQRQGRDHPRMCGEHISSEVAFFNAPGSSPHVRGAQPVVRAEHVVGGIIPACAGSTGPHHRTDGHRRDHPRMCGEHCAA